MTIRKQCSKCNKNLTLLNFFYSRPRKMYMSSCKKCNSKICRKYQSNQRKTGNIAFILKSRASGIRRNCKALKIKREVDPNLGDLLISQYTLQNGKCFYTGEQMTLTDYFKNDNFATVDRLDSSKGYIRRNLVFCISLINRMKQNMTIEQFKYRCRQINDNPFL